MTIATTTNRVDAPGNGSATNFSFAPVVIFEASDLQVAVRDSSGNETSLTQGAGSANYSVSVTAYPGTGSITYPASGGTPLPTGSTIVIKRLVPLLQTVSLSNQGAYFPKIQEGEFDYLTAIDQQQQEQLNRSLQLAPTDPAVPLTLPSSSARAGMVLGFDSQGSPTAVTGLSNGALVSAAMIPVVEAATVSAGLTLLGVSAAMQPVVASTTKPAALRSLLTPASNSPAVPISISAAPAYTGPDFALSTVFNGDFSKPALTFSLHTTGTALGQPSTGYLFSPTTSAIFGIAVNESGWNQGTADSTGRTALCPVFVESQNLGLGDMLTFCARGIASGTKPGATSWLANSAISLFAGDTFAGADGVYLNPLEVQCVDNGYAAAAGAIVTDLLRTNSGQSIGQSWMGCRMQSTGSVAVDAAYSAVGPYNFGMDFTTSTFVTADAIALAANQRIDFGASNTGGFPNGTVNSTKYMTYVSGSSLLSIVNGSAVLALSGTGMSFTGGSASFGGSILPTLTNAYQLGSSGNIWSSVWATSGVVSTSDRDKKTDIETLPPARPILDALHPKTWRWIEGGYDEVTEMVEQDVPVTETQTRKVEQVSLVDGVAVLKVTDETVEVPVFDEVGVVDAQGAPVLVDVPGAKEIRSPDGKIRQHATAPRTVQRMHQVQRTERKHVPVTQMTPRPGKRTHWGFVAQDVKAAFDVTGMDFGGYVVGEDGTKGLRTEQLIPVLWKAVQELAAEVDALKSALGKAGA